MLLLLRNRKSRSKKWRGFVLFSMAVMINIGLVLLMYFLTLGSNAEVTPTSVMIATVFKPQEVNEESPDTDPIFEMSQAPQRSSIPPPPVKVTMSVLDIASAVSVPVIKVPFDDTTMDFTQVSLTFSPKGNGNTGSVLSSAIAQAKPVFQVPPQYPVKAKRNAIEGFVTLDLKINPDGRAEEIKVVKEKPEGVFARSAKRAVVRWRFVSPKSIQWQRMTIRYELEK